MVPLKEQPLIIRYVETLQTQRDEDLAVQRTIHEVLEYHRTYQPKNTTKYKPRTEG